MIRFQMVPFWFTPKNETVNREVKLSFWTETMLIILSNWNLRFTNMNFSVYKNSITVVYTDNIYIMFFFVNTALFFKSLKP